MDQLVACFFPESDPSSFEAIDETFLSFIEEAVKAGDSSGEDLVALVQSVIPDRPVEDANLDVRIMKYRALLVGNDRHVNDEPQKSCDLSLRSVLFGSESKSTDMYGDSDTISHEEKLHDARNEELDASLEILRGVCGLSDDSEDAVLVFLMSRVVLGDAEDTARWLLDHSFQEAKQLKLSDDKRRREREKIDQEKERLARERIMNKFDEKAEPLHNEDSKSKVSRKQRQLANPSESKVRYLDGKVVATNGAKYIEIQQKDEWDGGSRGRVKTKGKRGTGWGT